MRALVTGGGGFLGRYIVEQLLKRGDTVTVLCRGDYPELTASKVTLIRADIIDKNKVLEACQNQEVVFHVAAKAGYWGKYWDYYQTNVAGTQNIIEACQKQKVKKLVFTSSPSVVFEGNDINGSDESISHAKKFLTYYQSTKAESEKLVLSANTSNDKEGLKTVALRPHIIWGPRDNHILPRLLSRAALGKLKIVGNGQNQIGIVYVENAAIAHLQAADSDKTSGKVYFITQKEPVFLWNWINQILEQLHIPKVEKKVSFPIAYALGACMEGIYSLFQLKSEPLMTRFLAAQLGKNHHFSIKQAQNDFGYDPQISTEEGMERLIQYYQQHPVV